MYKQGKYPIVSKKDPCKGIFDIEIYCPHIAKAAKAGQFAQVQAEGFSSADLSLFAISTRTRVLSALFLR